MKYKEGDRVKIKSLDWYNENKDEYGDVFCGEYEFVDLMTKFCGKVVTIQNCYERDCYTIKEDNEGYVFTGEMFEGLAEEISQKDEFDKVYQEMVEEADERFKNHKRPKITGVCQKCAFAVNDNNPHCGLRGFRNDFNVKSCSAKNDTIPNGFELQEDGYFSWINKREYPKTYEECAEIIAELTGSDCNPKGCMGYMSVQLTTLQKLLICRDAYWKIAGEEMGLWKPWEPDWNHNTTKYVIYPYQYLYSIDKENYRNTILAFPTAEMRNAFYENFKELINECKELL